MSTTRGYRSKAQAQEHTATAADEGIRVLRSVVAAC